MDISGYITLIAIGIAAGLLGGIFGLGGAIVIVPALVLFMGYSQHLAQGTALLMFVLPVGALAAFNYYKMGYTDVRAAAILGVTFFLSAYWGSKIAGLIPEELLKKAFAVLLLLIAVKIWFQK